MKNSNLTEKTITNRKKVGDNITFRRGLNGNMTQEELSTDSNVALATIKRYEGGETSTDYFKMGRIAKATNCTMDELQEGVIPEMDSNGEKEAKGKYFL